MGVKTRVDKPYKNKYGELWGDAYATIGEIAIGSYRKIATVVLFVFKDQNTRDLNEAEPITAQFIARNHTIEVDGETIEVNDFDNFLANIKIKPEGVTPSKKSYEFLAAQQAFIDQWNPEEV